MINKLFLLIFFLVAPVLSAPLQAGPLTPDQTPEPLKPWVDWVLHGKEETRCPRLPGSDATTLCPWPSRLTLNLKETGGRFRQEWQLFAPGWVPLPGGPQIWPQGLTVANKPHPLLARDGQPGVWLPVGQHQLEGNLLWQTMPESLPIPPATALIELTLSGQTVPFPSRDQEGWLWLRTKPIHDGNRPEDEDRMDLTVHRQIVDGVPVTIVTQVEAVVSGKSREVLLDQPLAEGFIPMNITSPLPARMEEDGRLRLQVRPGRWKIHLTHRLTGRGETIGLPHPPGKNWPTEEIWVFQANPSLRLIEPSGLPAVDPQQTSLPMDWRNLPAFLVKSGEAMTLNEKRRGASNLEERRFSMTRSWWLDFDGRGLTVQDRIQGTQQQPRRLEITHPFQLGRVVVAGRDQFITKLPESNFVGVELRDDSLDIIAESRIEDAANTLPVVGWNEDFQSLSGILHLPPGWRIFSVNGADSASPTWVGSWTLLDFFLLLITAMAVAKLWGRSWGFFTVITIALSYHDENALAWILLHILAAVALLRVVPTGRFRRFLEFYRGGAFVALAMVFLPFAVAQVRQGLHPQLEFPESMMTYGSAPPMEIQKVSQEAAATGDEMEEGAALTNRSSKTARYSILSGAPQPIESKKERLLEKIDPNARIQTGPGLPDWNWRKISLNWHGPVTRNQEITFHFLPPAANRFLSFARVLFFTLLLWRVAFPGPGSLPWSWKKMVPIALVFFFLGAPTPAKAADFPNPEMLQELQNRLLAPPDCLPNCTDISRMKIEITSEALRLLVEAHAQETSVLPLPGDFNNWSPKTILLNNLPASALARIPGGHLGLALEKGTHQIVMEGPLPYKERVQISLPVPPHRADLQAQGWSVEGILADGRVQASLLLIRESRKETDKTQETETLHGDPLPAFLNVVRRLHLHQDWSVDTTVTRLTPGNNAVVLRLPLLAGESVTTPGLQVEGGEILLNLPAHATSLSWSSRLTTTTSLTLTAPDQTAWSETWSVQVSPIWHMESVGIPPIQRLTGQEMAQTWNPWPGETLTLNIQRPQGTSGPTLTIQKATLNITPGQRAVDAQLDLTLLSSQGGQHAIQLPASARLNSLVINNRAQPINQQGENVLLPVTPGLSTYRLAWQEDRGMETRFSTSTVNLGLPSVNMRTTIRLPRDRWLLLAGGPQLGPAVLVWGVLAVIVLASLGLSRVSGLPLRFRQWFLLGTGLATVLDFSALAIVAWFFLMRKRSRINLEGYRWFNFMQLLLGFWTLVAFVSLLGHIHSGLLGLPEMQVMGNGSTLFQLNWYLDRSGPILPDAWVISLPLAVYRLIMLAWALWLAAAIMAWAKWGWECFSMGGIWRGKLQRKLEKE